MSDASGRAREETFVTGEFLIHTVYGCQVVVTNPTSSRQKLAVLVRRRSARAGRQRLHSNLRTWSRTGRRRSTLFYSQCRPRAVPVHVAKRTTIAAAEAMALNVVAQPTKIDESGYVFRRLTDQVIAL